MQRENLLPAITFIFSRNACTAAVKQCVDEGLWLTNKEERSQIREIVHQKTSHIPEEDLNVLGFHEWQYSLERGFAAHHAGLLPAFKETIEALAEELDIKKNVLAKAVRIAYKNSQNQDALGETRTELDEVEEVLMAAGKA